MWKFRMCRFKDIGPMLDWLDSKYPKSVSNSAKVIQSSIHRHDWFIWYREPEKVSGHIRKKRKLD